MTENDISREIVDTAFQVHTKLGPGLLETVIVLVSPILAHMFHELSAFRDEIHEISGLAGDWPMGRYGAG